MSSKDAARRRLKRIERERKYRAFANERERRQMRNVMPEPKGTFYLSELPVDVVRGVLKKVKDLKLWDL